MSRAQSSCQSYLSIAAAPPMHEYVPGHSTATQLHTVFPEYLNFSFLFKFVFVEYERTFRLETAINLIIAVFLANTRTAVV